MLFPTEGIAVKRYQPIIQAPEMSTGGVQVAVAVKLPTFVRVFTTTFVGGPVTNPGSTTRKGAATLDPAEFVATRVKAYLCEFIRPVTFA
jgi:hypothetical protein